MGWLRCDPDDMFKMHAYSGPAVWDKLPPVMQVHTHAVRMHVRGEVCTAYCPCSSSHRSLIRSSL